MITKEVKTQVISENAVHEGDTGSPEVQIAILTQRIRASGHVQDGRQAPPSARLPRQEGYRALPCDHCEAEHPQVICAVRFSEGYEGFLSGDN